MAHSHHNVGSQDLTPEKLVGHFAGIEAKPIRIEGTGMRGSVSIPGALELLCSSRRPGGICRSWSFYSARTQIPVAKIAKDSPLPIWPGEVVTEQ